MVNEKGKTAAATANNNDDVEAAIKNNTSPKKKKFPTPQYLVTIYTKNVVTVNRDDADAPLEQRWNENLMVPCTEEITKKKKIRVKMQSLLVKMINRLIREEVVPIEAVSVVSSQTYTSVRMLVAPSAVPIVMLRCERIGVGNVTGTVWSCPLETSLVPPPSGEKKEIDLINLTAQNVGFIASEVPNAPPSVANTAPSTIKLEESVEEFDEEVSDSDDNEEEEEEFSKSDVPSVVSTFLKLSPERKKKLVNAIIEARREWRNTSSRVRVLQVVEELTAGASFTFDYVLFVLSAAWIAAMGLSTDSGPTVIASMLVSPIMGPVMALTFGTTVKIKPLMIMGARNELLSLFLCFIVGAVVMIMCALWDTPSRRNWPSQEMLSRGDVYGLISGVFIAIPSGMATALSTLGKNSSGMVGVAISLSLLPPAVNASMCWTYELMLMSPSFNRNEGDTTDYFRTGGISFALTLINIVCIWLAGTFTFWLKEITPLKEKNAFWSTDLKEYRQNKDTEADLNVINDGIQAALELKNAKAEEDDLYKVDDIGITDHRAAVQRRQGLADNAVEDAFYIDTKALTMNIVPGGATDDLDEAALQDAADDTALKEDLLTNANKFGCLKDAGVALFDNELLPDEVPDNIFVTNDVGIKHGAVAEEILFNGLST